MQKNTFIRKAENLSHGAKCVLKTALLKKNEITLDEIIHQARVKKYYANDKSTPGVIEALSFMERNFKRIFRDNIDERYFIMNTFYVDVYPSLNGNGRIRIPRRIEELSNQDYDYASLKDADPSFEEVRTLLEKNLEYIDYTMIVRYYGLDGEKFICREKHDSLEILKKTLAREDGIYFEENIADRFGYVLETIRNLNILPERRTASVQNNSPRDIIEAIRALDILKKKAALVEALEEESKLLEQLKALSKTPCTVAKDAKEFLDRGVLDESSLDTLSDKTPLFSLYKHRFTAGGVITIRDFCREKVSRLFDIKHIQGYEIQDLIEAVEELGYTGPEQDMDLDDDGDDTYDRDHISDYAFEDLWDGVFGDD